MTRFLSAQQFSHALREKSRRDALRLAQDKPALRKAPTLKRAAVSYINLI
jgi:hypothetical protein